MGHYFAGPNTHMRSFKKSEGFLWLVAEEELKFEAQGRFGVLLPGTLWEGGLKKLREVPGWQPARKWAPQSYSLEEMNSANSGNLEVDLSQLSFW